MHAGVLSCGHACMAGFYGFAFGHASVCPADKLVDMEVYNTRKETMREWYGTVTLSHYCSLDGAELL
jgi:hypothetical protein